MPGPSGARRNTDHVVSKAMHRCEPVQLSIKTVGTHVPANALLAAADDGCTGVDVPHAAANAAPSTISR